MESARKNRFHSSDNFLQEEDTQKQYLSPFLRSSRSPSHMESKPLPTKMSFTPAAEWTTDRMELEQLRSHYEYIEKVLNDENANLKMQAKYLAAEMRKSLKREKENKEESVKATALCQRSRQRLAQIEQENAEIKEYFESKIIVFVNSLKLNHLHDLQQELKRIIQEFCQYFSINLEVKSLTKNEKIISQPQPQPQFQSQAQIDEYMQISVKRQQLNDKFEVLMSEFKSTNRPQFRKQCIDIAKEIKQLKVDQQALNEASHMQKTAENFSRIQSRQYLSVKNKNILQQLNEDRRQSLINTDESAFTRNISRKPSRKETYTSHGRPASFRHLMQKY